MKRLYATIVGATMILSVLFYARSQTRRPNPTQSPQTVTVAQPDQVELQSTVTTQQRLNRYFHSSVMPKLKNSSGAPVSRRGASLSLRIDETIS